MAGGRLIQPDMDFIREVKRAGGDTLKKCYQCATCATVCNLSPKDRPFPRKEMILAGWGQSDTLMRDPDVWLCHQCNDCSVYCPREARPGDVLAAIRSYAYKHFAFPSFMGKALASSKALPVLLLVPVVILLACISLFAPRTAAGGFLFLESRVIDFNNLLPAPQCSRRPVRNRQHYNLPVCIHRFPQVLERDPAARCQAAAVIRLSTGGNAGGDHFTQPIQKM